jgi:hypothetical protein
LASAALVCSPEAGKNRPGGRSRHAARSSHVPSPGAARGSRALGPGAAAALLLLALFAAQRPQHLPDPALAHPQHAGGVGRGQVPAAVALDHPPQLLDPLRRGHGPAPQGGQDLGGVRPADADLPGDLGRVELAATRLLVGAVELLDALQRPVRHRLVLELGSAAAGVGGPQRGELLGRGGAVLGWLAAQRGQGRVAVAGGAEGAQPLAGHGGGDAGLAGQLVRVEPAGVAAQLGGDERLLDAVAGQQHPHPPARRVALAGGPQRRQRRGGGARGDADLVGQLAGVEALAAVDLAGQPGGGDALERRPRVARAVRRWRGCGGGGHAATPSSPSPTGGSATGASGSSSGAVPLVTGRAGMAALASRRSRREWNHGRSRILTGGRWP